MCPMMKLALFFLHFTLASAFVIVTKPARTCSPLAASTRTTANSLQENLQILYRAADTRQEDSEAVYEALASLEQQQIMRQQAKQDYPTTAETTLTQLDGSWRLVFTTGTKNTQDRLGGGKINYL